MSNNPRGLRMFIADIRNAKTKEAETARVNKELAKIRQKFKPGQKVDAYDRKKYVLKLMYMFVLGYDVDFGLLEASQLMSSHVKAEKFIGYQFCSNLISEGSDFVRMITNTCITDLSGPSDRQVMALNCIGNIAGNEMAEAVLPTVSDLLTSSSGNVRTVVRKKAALVLLRLFRKAPDLFELDEFAEKVVGLLEVRNVGFLTAMLSLLLGFCSHDPYPFSVCVPRAAQLLNKIVIKREVSQEHIYYSVPCPWLQIKLMRFLRFLPPPQNQQVKEEINEAIEKIMSLTVIGKNLNQKNILFAVFFECLALSLHIGAEDKIFWDDSDPSEEQSSFLGILIRCMKNRESNMRYLALEGLTKLADNDRLRPKIREHQDLIVQALEDPDSSIKKRSVDLLFHLCNQDNCKEIVEELLKHLETSAHLIMRPELVLRIAFLSEKYRPDVNWYVDTIIRLLSVAGDAAVDEVWHRIVHLVSNSNSEQQKYASKRCMRALVEGARPHNVLVMACAFVLGEFGHSLAEGKTPLYSAAEQFTSLAKIFPQIDMPAKLVLVSAFAKIHNWSAQMGLLSSTLANGNELGQSIRNLLSKYRFSLESELQTRVCEMLVLLEKQAEDVEGDGGRVAAQVLEMLPALNMEEFSNLEKRLREESGEVTEQSKFRDGAAITPERSSSPSSTESDNEMGDLPGIKGKEGDEVLDSMSPQKARNVLKKQSTLDELLDLVNEPDHAALEDSSLREFDEVIEKHVVSSALMPKTSGVLYEDNLIQVGLKIQSIPKSGVVKFLLFFGNKGKNPFRDFKSVPLAKREDLTVETSEMPGQLEPGSQLRQQISVFRKVDSLIQPPVIQVVFVTGPSTAKKLKKYSFELELPVSICRFFQHGNPTPPEFFETWKSMGTANEFQRIVPLVDAIEKNFFRELVQGLGFGLIDDVDPKPNNIVGAAVYQDTRMMLLRIEVSDDFTVFRTTIRSDSGISKEVGSVILSYLVSKGMALEKRQ